MNKHFSELFKNKVAVGGFVATAALFLALIFLANKSQTEADTFSDFPTPQYSGTFSANEIEKIQGSHLAFDKSFVGVSTVFFKEFNEKYTSMVFHNTRYTKGSFECNHFAVLYKGLMSTTVIKNNSTDSIGVGILAVKHTTEWGGVPVTGNEYHMVNAVKVDGRWVVVEPQPEKGYINYTELSEYPNEILFSIF
jgi:hypothetical protein